MVFGAESQRAKISLFPGATNRGAHAPVGVFGIFALAPHGAAELEARDGGLTPERGLGTQLRETPSGPAVGRQEPKVGSGGGRNASRCGELFCRSSHRREQPSRSTHQPPYTSRSASLRAIPQMRQPPRASDSIRRI